MLTGKRAVIFDLDGTLVDSMWMWKKIDIEYLERFHIPLPKDLQKRISGMSFQETAVYFKREFKIPDTIEQIKQDWNEMAVEKYRSEVFLKPGVKEFLQALQNANYRTGIATSNSEELTRTVLNSLGIRHLFDAVHTAGEVKKGKPAPDIYLHVASHLSTTPEQCLVFEDLPEGIEGAKKAGMQVCAVEDEFSAAYEDEKRQNADYYIKDYYEIALP